MEAFEYETHNYTRIILFYIEIKNLPVNLSPQYIENNIFPMLVE